MGKPNKKETATQREKAHVSSAMGSGPTGSADQGKSSQTSASLGPSVLNDPKAAVIAAIIGAIGLVFGAGIGFAGKYLINREKPHDDIVVKKAEQDIKDKSKQTEQVINSYDEALKAIQGMKDTISNVISKPNISNGDGSRLLEKSFQNLINAYGGNPETGSRASYIDICGAVPRDCPFHKAKDIGRAALTWVQSQPEKDPLSVDAPKRLGEFRADLDKLQDEITKSRALFTGNNPH